MDAGAGGGPSPNLAPRMVVTPDGSFAAAGPVGGPFTPTFLTYQVTNDGGGVLSFDCETTEPWAEVAPTGGALASGESLAVTVTIHAPTARGLVEGVYTGSVDFTELPDRTNRVSRGLVLRVQGTPGLTVTPGTEFRARGPKGGPFSPGSFRYTLHNTGTTSVTWNAVASIPQIDVQPSAGTLAPNTQVDVDVTIDQAAAAGLVLGTYTERVDFLDPNDPTHSTSRDVVIQVDPPSGGSGTLTSEITQFGLTWHFARPVEAGTFANGDWWVVGPVTIDDISPGSTQSGTRVESGSVLNPSPMHGMVQGYDSSTYAQYRSPGDYEPGLNVAFGVSTAQPLVVQPGSSLVSTISEPKAAVRPQLRTAAILTVLSSAPPAGSFRPPYSGSRKDVRFNESQLDTSRLARLKPTASVPSFATLEAAFRRPWLDHVPLWVGRYIHPSENMPDYGRNMAERIGTASLLLNLDVPDAQKHDLLVEFVQLGIDLYGVAQDGGRGNWPPSAGHMSGRKWPILFAGIVLGDPDMSSVGFDKSILFGEDGQTFYVEETSPGVYNYGYGGYTAADVGTPEWGTAHSLRPWFDDSDWFGDPYRHCCTANAWWGQLLSAYAMGAKDLWDHDALFDYQDRYLSENRARGITDWRLTWTRFPLEMWDAYRANY